ncbi:MAG: TrmO family methyltransferase [Bacteroidales bacterium]|nr:TrmO family methyltransferase [Bacteroidales bacterium]MCF8458354.1 TrmO family methyltransferase [Bacteroidales bacterium]
MDARIEFKIYPIGFVKKQVTGNTIEIDEEFRDGLLELENYNYMHVLWWANDYDTQDQRKLVQVDIPYSKEKIKAGVFACRSPQRPNLVMNSVCKIVGINHKKGRIFIENIDANNSTPVIDIKPYIHCNDRVKDARVPRWFPTEWGEWYPAGGIG